MQDKILELSATIRHQDDQKVKILSDDQALRIGSTFNCQVRDVFIAAMRMDITPLRYIRNQNSVSLHEQLKLAESKVTVIGAGGLGGNAILQLARIGVGHLNIVDHDKFDETNMNRQVLATVKSIGHSKADQAEQVLKAINPGVVVSSFFVKIDQTNVANFLNGADVVIDALDNAHDRILLEKAAMELKIPFVHGAVAGFEGRVMTIFPGDPGLKTLYGNQEDEKSNSSSPEAILGIPGLAPTVIASYQVMEAIKIILGRDKIFRNTMVYINLLSGDVEKFKM